VPRSRTAINFGASNFEWNKAPTCPECGVGDIIKRWKRIVIDGSTWNGEDVFFARGLPGEIIVSSQFKDFCESNIIQGAIFLPTETYGRDFYPSK
jgi:hypothetical protein